MAVSRLSDGEKKKVKRSCKNQFDKDCEKSGDTDEAKNKNLKFRKEVIYSEKSNEPTQTKVIEKKREVISDAIKEEQKPETKGVISDKQTGQKSYDSGNKSAGKDDMSRVKETRYFKKRSKIGKILSGGKEEKQMGGKFESQTKSGEKEVITFKGKGRGAKKFVEKKDVVEREKEKYEEKKKGFESKRDILGKLPLGAEKELASMNYVTKKLVGGTDSDYRLGDATKDKEWKVGKDTYKSEIKDLRKANKKKDVKVRRDALSKVRLK